MISNREISSLSVPLTFKWNLLYICSKRQPDPGPKLPGRRCPKVYLQRLVSLSFAGLVSVDKKFSVCLSLIYLVMNRLKKEMWNTR